MLNIPKEKQIEFINMGHIENNYMVLFQTRTKLNIFNHLHRFSLLFLSNQRPIYLDLFQITSKTYENMNKDKVDKEIETGRLKFKDIFIENLEKEFIEKYVDKKNVGQALLGDIHD